MKFKGRFLPSLLAAGCLAGAGAAQAGMITYDTWTSNENGSGNYIFTVNDNDAGYFNYNLTVDPWNAEALGLFVDFGSETTGGGSAMLTGANVALVGQDTSSNSCGAGCNLEGLSFPASFDGLWGLVFRLGEQGFDGIQTFSWQTSDFGLGLDDFGLVAIRAQQFCSEGTLDGENDGCEGSDKSYSSERPPVSVPEPGTLGLLGLGLLALAIRRKKAS